MYQYDELTSLGGHGQQTRTKFMSCSIDQFTKLFVTPETVTKRPPQIFTCGHPDREYYAHGCCSQCYEKARLDAKPEIRRRKQRQQKKRYLENPGLQAAQSRAWADRNPVKHALMGLRQSARARHLAFDLDEAYLRSIWVDVCPMLGLLLKRTPGDHDSSHSVDRIDSTRGYIKGNVHIISLRANRIKNNATVEEIEKIAAYLRSLEPSCL